MMARKLAVGLALAATLILPCSATAGSVRFHYVPANGCGTLTLKPCGPNGGAGESVSWFGATTTATTWAPRVNTQLTFRHPYTGQQVTVPVYLPPYVPRIEYRTHWVVYNYGSFATEIHFLSDGSVDVVYRNGLFRRI